MRILKLVLFFISFLTCQNSYAQACGSCYNPYALHQRIDSLESTISDLVNKINQIECVPTLYEETGEIDNYGNRCLTENSEIKWLTDNAIDAINLAKLYNRNNPKRRCFSTKEIHLLFGGNGKGRERDMAAYIFQQILLIRNI